MGSGQMSKIILTKAYKEPKIKNMYVLSYTAIHGDMDFENEEAQWFENEEHFKEIYLLFKSLENEHLRVVNNTLKQKLYALIKENKEKYEVEDYEIGDDEDERILAIINIPIDRHLENLFDNKNDEEDAGVKVPEDFEYDEKAFICSPRSVFAVYYDKDGKKFDVQVEP